MYTCTYITALKFMEAQTYALEDLLTELAALHEAAATKLRRYVGAMDEIGVSSDGFLMSALARARKLHPTLGVRQAEALKLIADAHPAGVGTGHLTKEMHYDQPNVYLTLQALVRQGLVRKDDESRPHAYFLSSQLLNDAGASPVLDAPAATWTATLLAFTSERKTGEQMETGSPPIRAFLSYEHGDDKEFGVVDPLVSKLKAIVRAKSGRNLEIFIDRESIGWGADWRASISGSVENATVFIPLLSANYLDSAACREEFLAFHSKAEVLGVTELLLPILLFKSSLFSEGTTDEVAQIAEARQYKCIEEALLAGYQSPEWLQCTRDLAESLLGALAKAENSLLEGGLSVPPAPVPETMQDGGPPAETEVSGLAELMEELQSSLDGMTGAADKLTPAIEAFGDVPAKVGELPDAPTPKQVNTWALRLAHEFKEPSVALEAGGRELFDATKRLDETLLRLKQLTESVGDVPEFSESLTEGRKGLITGFGDLHEVADTMEELLNSMRPAELLSVPVRKAIQPARRGLTAVRDSLRMIESWQSEFPQ